MIFVNNKQIAAEEAAAIPQRTEILFDELTRHIRTRWDAAKRAKETSGINNQMLKNKRARAGEYDPSKLNAIKQLHGPDYMPVYMMITETKCRAAESWIKDIMMQPNEEPWDLDPTPIPELPPLITQSIVQSVYTNILNAIVQQAYMTGAIIDEQALIQQLRASNEEVMEQINKAIKRYAKKAAEKMKEKIADQFAETGWNDEFEKVVHDVVTYPAGILKGPMQRKNTVRRRLLNETGKWDIKIEERIMSKYERRPPWNIYPAPDSNGINNGYLFDLIHLTPKDLSDLIGVPGFKESAIREVLNQYREGGLREWTYTDSQRLSLENKSSQALIDSEKIDCLEYWGSAQGRMLRVWGLSEQEVPDEDKEYNICAWLIGNHIIKAMVNPDIFGRKPFHKTSFVEDPDAFWNKAIPDLIEDIQGICNSVARGLVNNVGIGSGPQVEVNMDRAAVPGETTTLYPWKIWKVTTAQMAEGKAVNFYMPPTVVDKLLKVFEFCLKLTDEWSGIPRYAHGDPETKGAGHTASGLSMLMSQAARGIKNVVKNLDRGIITSAVTAQYDFNMQYEEDMGIFGDLKVVAKGSSSLIAKEQQALRRTEFMDRTLNPYDMSIIGVKGRAELLKQTAKSLDMDVDRIIQEENMLDQLEHGGPDTGFIPNRGDIAKGANTNPAGEPVSGEDFTLFKDKEMVNA